MNDGICFAGRLTPEGGSSRVQIISGAASWTKIIESRGLAALPAGFGEEN